MGVDQAGSHLLTGWSSHVGSGTYQAELTKWVSVSSDSQLSAMAEVLNDANGYGGMTSDWKYLDLDCRFGPGDKAPNPTGQPDREIERPLKANTASRFGNLRR